MIVYSYQISEVAGLRLRQEVGSKLQWQLKHEQPLTLHWDHAGLNKSHVCILVYFEYNCYGASFQCTQEM